MQSYEMDWGRVTKITMSCLIVLVLTSFVHPFYLSVSQVSYNEGRKNFEISSRIFTDDLEHVLRMQQGSVVNLYYTRNQEETDSIVKTYLFKHLQLEVNGRKMDLKFLGYEKEEEASWCYFESGIVEDPRNIRIINTILYDRGAEQSNIIHLELKGVKKSYKLNQPDSIFYFNP